jgi:squalene monooxygenase
LFVCRGIEISLGCTEGIDAITNIGYGVFYDKLAIPMTYPLDPASGKPLTGRSFHHGRFVMKLREKCLSHAR